jgi:hypothetical protein
VRTRALERKLRGVESLPAEDDDPPTLFMAAGD